VKLCGVLLSYAAADVAGFLESTMGWNFAPAELGQRITRDVVDLVLAGAVKPVVGSVVDFESAPAAMAAMANRETTGRTVVTVRGLVSGSPAPRRS